MFAAHVYVHVPFCARRCSYCDFAIAVRSTVPVDEYIRGVDAEIAIRHPEARGTRVDTLYLGGGTPSRLGGDGVARLIDLLRSRFDVASEAEITLEINPDDVSPDHARMWRAAGATRTSVGAQSFSNDALRWMHRTHDAPAIPRAMEQLRDAGFDDCSLDLIFALPPSVERDWRRDLEQAIALRPSHVSLYGLTVEPKTPAARMRSRGEIADAPEERYESDYLLAHELLTAAGFDHYEVSNFARPGRRSRHNSAYWRGVSYIGLGPGAHEFDGTQRRWNDRGYARWLSLVRAGTDPVDGSEQLIEAERETEAVYLGLRTSDGMDVDGIDLALVHSWCQQGWAAVTNGKLHLTPLGWLRLDALSVALTVHGSRY